MAKQYGLIIPGQQKKVQAPKQAAPSRPSIFDESSDSDDDDFGPPQLKKMTTTVITGPGAMERRLARRVQEKALEEDPTIFQYDELYDEMENKREQEEDKKSKEPKKPKYIERLMKCAERRKLENELRIERQVQKEREQEGEEFRDKESFVTSAYREKLEEMRKLQEQEKRDEYLEAIGDVTKQKDLDGFYRHLYEQKLGTAKEAQKPSPMPNTAAEDEEISYKPIKSEKSMQQRTYRKRHASDDEEDGGDGDDVKGSAMGGDAKKVHLPNNIDADSDFSIDSSEDEDDDEKKAASDKLDQKDSSAMSQTDVSSVAINLDSIKKETIDTSDEIKKLKEEDLEPTKTVPEPSKPKRDKAEVWRKRTVGQVFEDAVKRFFERKAQRSCA